MGYLTETEQFRFPKFSGDHYLSELDRAKLSVLFDALFPPDHAKGRPGATDANAHDFVSYLLALDDDTYYKLPSWRSAYDEGLPALDAASTNLFGKEIQDLNLEDSTALLSQLEDNQLSGWADEFNQRAFFRLLLEHCIKGCFSDPRWGGNKDRIMWRWLGWIQPAEDIPFEAEHP